MLINSIAVGSTSDDLCHGYYFQSKDQIAHVFIIVQVLFWCWLSHYNISKDIFRQEYITNSKFQYLFLKYFFIEIRILIHVESVICAELLL